MLLSISAYGFSQKYSNTQGREVLFGEENEEGLFELYVDPTGFDCECEQITIYLHFIGNNKYTTDDGNVEITVSDKSLNIKVIDETECCFVKKGIYTIE
jgi:hypothetical protein